MLHFRRIDPVKPLLHLKYVTFVGAGGKTSLIEHIAAGLVQQGKTVAITTTTKIYGREPYAVIEGNRTTREWRKPLVRIGKTLADGKLTGVDPEDIEHLGSVYDVVLIEGDGAKGQPLKVPASYEPVIAPLTQWTFVVSGLDALFGRVDKKVFRWELFKEATGIPGDSLITPEVFMGFFSPHLLLKGVDTRKRTVVLNKYDALSSRVTATAMAGELAKKKGPGVIISSVLYRFFYEVGLT